MGSMRRLYYLADNIDTATLISQRLHAEGITDWNFHVLAKDEAGLYTHNLHSALPLHKRDIVRTGERWGVLGACVGMLLGLALHIAQPLPWYFDRFSVVLFMVVGGLVGAMQGCVAGSSRENYKIAAFHDDIEDGRLLIMVDVKAADKAKIREIMNLHYPQVSYRGNESPMIYPFKPAHRVRPRGVPI